MGDSRKNRLADKLKQNIARRKAAEETASGRLKEEFNAEKNDEKADSGNN